MHTRNPNRTADVMIYPISFGLVCKILGRYCFNYQSQRYREEDSSQRHSEMSQQIFQERGFVSIIRCRISGLIKQRASQWLADLNDNKYGKMAFC